MDFCELDFSQVQKKMQALEFCLNIQALTEYTLSERYAMFCNLHPNFTQHILRSMYGIAPVSKGRFDTSKLIQFGKPGEVDTQKVLQNTHRDRRTRQRKSAAKTS